MKKLLSVALLSTLSSTVFAANLDTEDKKITYAIGTQLGQTLKNNLGPVIKVDQKVLIEAITDALDGKDAQMKPEEINKTMQGFSKKAGEQAKKALDEQIAKNKAESEKLLKENKAKKGVTVTKSGLQYRVVKAGKGKKPTTKDTVKVHYKGTLTDGKEFDSSYKRGEPIEFPLAGVIKGWTEGLQLMPVGSKYEFVIPANLAYGDQAPPSIGPAQALTFEVELLGIVTEKKAVSAKKPAEAKAVDTKKAVEAKAVKAKAVDVKKAVEAKAVDAKKAVEAKAVDVKKAVEAKAVDVKKAVEAKAVDVKKAVETKK